VSSTSWYDDRTGRALAQEAIDHSKALRIAFVSTPAAYRDFLKIQREAEDAGEEAVSGEHVYLLEFDRRFEDKYGEHFVFYDYNTPTDLPDKFHHFFDYILVDPPYLVRRDVDLQTEMKRVLTLARVMQNPNCMGKFADTMRWLAKDVQAVPGKKDKILNPCTFITGMSALSLYRGGALF
jgi:hypothetical protein